MNPHHVTDEDALLMCIERRYFSIHISFMHEYLPEGAGLFIYILMMNYFVDYCYEGINANVCRVEVSLS